MAETIKVWHDGNKSEISTVMWRYDVYFRWFTSFRLSPDVNSDLHYFDIDHRCSLAHALLYWWSVWCRWSWRFVWRILQATMS